MDYRSIRKAERLKRRGKDTILVEKQTPERIDYTKRRAAVIIILLAVIAAGLGGYIAIKSNFKPSLSNILPAAPTQVPTEEKNDTDIEDSLTDGEGNPLPTVEAPNTYILN